MNVRKIKNEGLKSLLIFLTIDFSFILLGIISKIANNFLTQYYLYGIVPIWLLSLVCGIICGILVLKSIIKYLKSYNKYDNVYIKKVNNELSINYNKIGNTYLTDSFIISTLNGFAIVEYTSIDKVIKSTNGISVQCGNKIIGIANDNYENCKVITDYILSKNKNAIKSYQ